MPSGCAFAPRCERAMKICLEGRAPEVFVGKDHISACWMNVKEGMEKDAIEYDSEGRIVRMNLTEVPEHDTEQHTRSKSKFEAVFSRDYGLLKTTMLKAVDDVSFTIGRSETLGLVGESGCGKTTVGRTLLHLYKPTGGEVWFDGKKVDAHSIGEHAAARKWCFRIPTF